MHDPALPWSHRAEGPLAQRIAADTARAVIQGSHSPGALLTEVDLAATFGVSRTPAREAMLQLEAWGLVRLLPKKGAVVTTVSPAERRDLLSVRSMFEVESVAALTAVGNGLDGVAGALLARIDEQRAALAANDLLAFAAADYAFHAGVILAGGNTVVRELLTTLAPRLTRLTHQACLERPGSLPRLLAEHERLAWQARTGDVDGFSATIRAHIKDTYYPDGEDR